MSAAYNVEQVEDYLSEELIKIGLQYLSNFILNLDELKLIPSGLISRWLD